MLVSLVNYFPPLIKPTGVAFCIVTKPRPSWFFFPPAESPPVIYRTDVTVLSTNLSD